jgi:hypothetical protein
MVKQSPFSLYTNLEPAFPCIAPFPCANSLIQGTDRQTYRQIWDRKVSDLSVLSLDSGVHVRIIRLVATVRSCEVILPVETIPRASSAISRLIRIGWSVSSRRCVHWQQ